MILFKYKKSEKELDDAPKILRAMIYDFDRLSTEFGIDMTITRIIGKIKGDSGVHSDHRAVDVRDNYVGKDTYNVDQRLAIFHFLNAKYPRNDGKLVCIRHSFNGAPEHFHLQIPYGWKHLNKYSDIFNDQSVQSH